MLIVDIYFYNDERIRIENIIMIQTINNRLVILYKIERYKDYTEVKYYPMDDIDCYIVGKRY